MSPLLRRAFAGVLAILLAQVAPAARGDASTELKVRCANAYEQAQRTRNDGLLRASRDHLLVCANDACPAVLRTECVKWLGEIEQALPTVIVIADAGGAEVFDVSVTIDGTRVLERLDGKAIAVDPGVHTFRFARDGGDAVEQKLLVREGEKRRPIRVSFAVAPKPLAPSDEPKPAARVPAATWILGGVGLVCLGASVPLYLTAADAKSELDADPCAARGTCDPDRVATVKRKFVYGDVAAIFGTAALVGAAVVWFTAPPQPAVRAGVAPLPGGVAGSFVLAF
ncbi:MAG: hypothetical protein HYV09_23210 [Deltaproteobacteria bacterium]|nr:hypothetical protein [Deltaproteobacteria bacterium]